MLVKLYKVVFCLLCITAPLESVFRAAPNILVIILVVLFPFVIKKKQLLKLKDSSTMIFALLILMSLFRELLVSSDAIQLKFVEKTMVLPIVYTLSLPIKKNRELLLSLLAGFFLVIIISLFNVINYQINSEEFDFSNGDVINQVLFIERLYLGLCCALSFIVSLYLLRFLNATLRVVIYANIICCVFTVFIVSARMAILTIITISIFLVFRELSRTRALLLTATLTLFVSVFFLSNQNLRNRFFFSNDKSNLNFVEKFQEWEPRVAIWRCALSNFNDYNKFIGVGKAKNKMNLLDCYAEDIQKEDKRNWFVIQQFNTHNQFLDVLNCYGLMGFVIILAFFISFYKKVSHDSFLLSLFLTLLMFSLVESLFDRQIGIYLFSLVFMLSRNVKPTENSVND